MNSNNPEGKEHRSGIYLLPNLFTTASLFAAFYSIVASMKGHYESAVISIYIGMLADGLDGRIARLTNTQTAFGGEYDSLSDMVTFGVAPALLLYSWSLQTLGKVGWLVAFIYTASVALRLARFNTQISTQDKSYFQGLACPPGAAMIASFVWLCHQNQWQHAFTTSLAAMMALVTAVLMVSNVRYYSFKDVDFKGRVPFIYILITVLLFVAIAAHPALVLLLASSGYALSGPIQTLRALHQVKNARNQAKEKQD